MRFVAAPDSFKGSLPAPEAARAMARGLLRGGAGAVAEAPMADGGEGTLDAVLARGGERLRVPARDAGGRERAAAAGRLPGGEGVAEVAEAVGLALPGAGDRPALARDSRGVGDLLRALLDGGARRVTVALGGSSTTDGGAGALAALGLGLFDAAGAPVEPSPAGLARLARVEAGGLDPRLRGLDLRLLADVTNPLTGPAGAAAVFGPQKGLDPAGVAAADAALARFAALAGPALAAAGFAPLAGSGPLARDAPGAGAAGGLGYGLGLVGGRIEPGAEAVARLTGLDALVAGADWAVAGEGRSDAQTPLGKAPAAVARAARAAGAPASLLSGGVDPDRAARDALNALFDGGLFAIAPGPLALDECRARAAELLELAAEQLARAVIAARRGRP